MNLKVDERTSKHLSTYESKTLFAFLLMSGVSFFEILINRQHHPHLLLDPKKYELIYISLLLRYLRPLLSTL